MPFPFPYPETFDAHMAAGLSVAGSPRTVREFLSQDTAAAGANGVICQMVFGSIAYDDALNSLELFAKDVMPAMRKEPA